MDAVHRWKENVFVDYCHFTGTVNKKIGIEISCYILSDSNTPVFIN
jgi:hypothetical protein